MCEAMTAARETCKRLAARFQVFEREDAQRGASVKGEEEEKRPYSHCLRCGKVLRKPESQRRGYGDTCWQVAQQFQHGAMEKPADEPREQQPAR